MSQPVIRNANPSIMSAKDATVWKGEITQMSEICIYDNDPDTLFTKSVILFCSFSINVLIQTTQKSYQVQTS